MISGSTVLAIVASRLNELSAERRCFYGICAQEPLTSKFKSTASTKPAFRMSKAFSVSIVRFTWLRVLTIQGRVVIDVCVPERPASDCISADSDGSNGSNLTKELVKLSLCDFVRKVADIKRSGGDRGGYRSHESFRGTTTGLSLTKLTSQFLLSWTSVIQWKLRAA